ncbi:MAG: hypothetical protein IPG71_01855 [bacterium]|nr:hypothetical protein [bacterium]
MKTQTYFRLAVLAVIAVALLRGQQAYAADSDIGVKGIGLRLGYVDPESEYSGTVLLGAFADLGTITDKLYVDASLTYWSSDWDYNYYDYDWTVSLTDIALRGGVKYHFSEGEWEPYAGGGLAMHFYSASYESPSGYSWSYSGADGSDFGIYICGGVEKQLSEKIIGSGELMLDFSGVGQTALQVNLAYMLGK